MLGPFAEVDLTYSSLRVTTTDGSEEVISRRVDAIDASEYRGREYVTVLFVDSPSAPSVAEIAINASDV